MAWEGKQDLHSIVASADLSDQTLTTGPLHKAVSMGDGDIAATGLDAGGLIKFGEEATNHMSFGYFGIMKYAASGTIAANAQLTVTGSGYVTTAGSGDWVVGRNIEDAVTSGSVGTGMFNFINPPGFHVNSQAAEAFNFTTINSNFADGSNIGKAVDYVVGDIAGLAANANGVMVTTTASGAVGAAQIMGIAECRAGDVILAGTMIRATGSAWFITADSGSLIFGRAIDGSAAGNSGGLFTAAINFATPPLAVSCLALMV